MTRPDAPPPRRDPLAAGLDPARAPGHLTTASKLPVPIPMELEVIYRGRRITLRPTVTVEQLDALCDRLDRLGAVEPPRPPVLDPSGNPICSKHHATMKLREHQGDRWYSHKVKGPDGQEEYCKGHPGPDSPGYDL